MFNENNTIVFLYIDMSECMVDAAKVEGINEHPEMEKIIE